MKNLWANSDAKAAFNTSEGGRQGGRAPRDVVQPMGSKESPSG